jgi:hypothetical protein
MPWQRIAANLGVSQQTARRAYDAHAAEQVAAA